MPSFHRVLALLVATLVPVSQGTAGDSADLASFEMNGVWVNPRVAGFEGDTVRASVPREGF